jgi:hypothetical protein
MRAKLIAFAVPAFLAFTAAAYADCQSQTTAGGAVTGAVTGAVIGGPVGAVVGGMAGAAAGSTLCPPPAPVETWIVGQQQPSVAVQGQVVVGQPLPGPVQVYSVQPQPEYSYAIINHKHVVIDPRTNVVIAVYD